MNRSNILEITATNGQEGLYEHILGGIHEDVEQTARNLDWLARNMPPYFYITMKNDKDAVGALANNLHRLPGQRRVTLVDENHKLILARLDKPGSLYETILTLDERKVSYAEMTHSVSRLPGSEFNLEIQRFEFDPDPDRTFSDHGESRPPARIRKDVQGAIALHYPGFKSADFDRLLDLLWLNNEPYVLISPALRVARVLWLWQQAKEHDGLFIDVEAMEGRLTQPESRLLFSVGNPPREGYINQVMEIFQRLNIGVRRFYYLSVKTELHPYMLGTFYLQARDGRPIARDSDLFRELHTELYNTQVLSTTCRAYQEFLPARTMTGVEASLTNAFTSFCHSTLAHNQPDRFDLEVVKNAFHAHPEMTLKLIHLFRLRFDPDQADRRGEYEEALAELSRNVEDYNTGHKHIDELRKTIFRTCLLFITHTLKTNFYVPEKHALSFRLDPGYLDVLGASCTGDLPDGKPFRVTFFFSRYGFGYHIGFSDIARGGWRTIISRTPDEYVTSADNLFREAYVLAHTQHLKNKDIYEGGSKLVVLLDARDCPRQPDVTRRLYKLQYGILNAFLDIFITQDGRARHERVVDYYGDDEAIELGPDENMHDNMIEFIARQSVKKGYILGIGLISSKKVGINHKEYGVTSRGVIKTAEIVMSEVGLDMLTQPFTVRFTGGPGGDVGGNCMKLLLERCPGVRMICVVDGSGGLYDPAGADPSEIGRLVTDQDIEKFDPGRLHPGGFMLFRNAMRREALRVLYRKVYRTETGLEESWITSDELVRQTEGLVFGVETDLFLPCGGRPETIDAGNWKRFLDEEGRPSAKVIVEGANSFITPEARVHLQQSGVMIIRDASANKCGVISSSYEIIANLLMSEKEFVANKKAYVDDVLKILDKRSADETALILRRHRESGGRKLFTEISSEISEEINGHYAAFFPFFQERKDLVEDPLFRKIILNHMPAFVRNNRKYRSRVFDLPGKFRYAILAGEIASFIVYNGGWDGDLETRLRSYIGPRLV